MKQIVINKYKNFKGRVKKLDKQDFKRGVSMLLVCALTATLAVFNKSSEADAVDMWVTNSNILNYASSYHAYNPESVIYNNEIFTVWSEYDGYRNNIRYKRGDGTTWTADNVKLNYSSSYHANKPKPIIYNGEVYVFWNEVNSSTKNQIRFKKWNGTAWTNDAGSLNYDTTKDAVNVSATILNNKIYIFWEEKNASAIYQIRYKVFDGSTWATDANSLNYDVTKAATGTNTVIYNNELYAFWEETNGTANQLRYKKFNGASWSSDSGSLNYDTTKVSATPSLYVYNNELYASWSETNALTKTMIRYRKFDGVGWTADPGTMNYDTAVNAQNPRMVEFKGEMYLFWQELASTNDQVRYKKWDGSTWSNDTGSLNYNTSKYGIYPLPVVYNNNLYAFWLEFNGTAQQLRYKQYMTGLGQLSIAGSFTESAANDGSIGTTRQINLDSQTFSGVVGEDFVASGKVTVNNVPNGLTAKIVKTTDNQLEFSLTGNASQHASTNTISNLQVIFNASAFACGDLTKILGNNLSSSVSFVDNPTITTTPTSLTESTSNDGSVPGSVTISISGNTFQGAGNLVDLGYVTVDNVPAGLTAVVTKVDSLNAKLTFTGNATNHQAADSLTNIKVNFLASAFVDQSAGKTVVLNNNFPVTINFTDNGKLTYDTQTLNEDVANDGTVNATITGTLTGDTFTGSTGIDYTAIGACTVNNLPQGLTATVTQGAANNKVIINITGKATSHALSDSINNLEIKFLDSAFNSGKATGVINSDSLFNVNFLANNSFSYSGDTLNESISNNGSMDNTIDVTVDSDTFTGNLGDDFIVDGKVSVIGLPVGMTASVVKQSDTKVKVSILGNATLHQVVDNTTFTLTFDNSALASNNAATATNNNKVFNLSFKDNDGIKYFKTVLNESVFNDGSVTDTIDISIDSKIGTTFTGANDEDFVSAGKIALINVPAGLQGSIKRLNDSTLRLSFSGKALNHEVVNSVSNIGIEFKDGAFSTNTSAGVSGVKVSNIAITFKDELALNYDKAVFKESSLNDGSIDGPINITLTGDNTFSNIVGYNYVTGGDAIITNLPAELTCTIVKASDTKVVVSLSGNATNHDISDVVSNLGIEFKDSAFTKGNAASIKRYKRSDIYIAYRNNGPVADSTITTSNVSGFLKKSLGIPVIFNNTSNAVAYSFKLQYDSAALKFNGLTDGITANSVNSANALAGEVVVGSVDTEGKLIPSGQVFTANFIVLNPLGNKSVKISSNDIVDFDMTTTQTLDAMSTLNVRQYGDILNTGTVGMSNVVKALRASMAIDTLSGDDFTAGDVNGDGKISNLDVIYILKRALADPTTFPVEN